MAATIILLFQLYAGIGAVIAIAFLCWGIDRIDEDAHGTFVFRLLLIPGVVGLWPLVLYRWRALERERS